jgi:uncharacterized phage protein (TIGR02220 family)
MMDVSKTDIGWIKFHRKIRKWKYYGKLKYEKIWQMLLIEANYDNKELDGINIKRGELIFSYRSFLKKLENCDPEITERGLRTIIKNLQKHNQIKVNYLEKEKFTLIKIVNYDKYQRDDSTEYRTKLEELEAENARLRGIIYGNDAQKTDTVNDTVNDTVTQGEPTQLKSKNDTVKNVSTGECDGQMPLFNGALGKNENKATGIISKNDTVKSGNRHDDTPKTDTESDTESDTPKRNKEKKNKKELINIRKETKQKKLELKEKKRLEKLEEKQKEKERIFSIVEKTIDHLNKKTNQNFRVTEGNGHYKILKQRINENYKLEDFIKVIDYMASKWMGTKWQNGLSSKKLFGDEFDTFLGQSSNYQKDCHLDFDSPIIDEEILRKEREEREKMEKEAERLEKQLRDIKKSKQKVVLFDNVKKNNIDNNWDAGDW